MCDTSVVSLVSAEVFLRPIHIMFHVLREFQNYKNLQLCVVVSIQEIYQSGNEVYFLHNILFATLYKVDRIWQPAQ